VHRSFSRLFKRLSRRTLRGATLLAVAAKLVVPLGYMPGALADGGPFVLCPAGLPPEFRVALADAADADVHASHAELDTRPAHDHADGAPWERCTLGGLAGLVPLAFTPFLVDAAPGPDGVPVFVAAAPGERTAAIVRSRGPPSRSG